MKSLAGLLALAALASGCGPAAHWVELAPAASSGGVEMRTVDVQRWDQMRPYLPPAGRSCVGYTIVARSIDGHRHELRAGDFRTDHGRPAGALGPCGRPQLDPTWVDARPRSLVVTVLTPAPQPEPLWASL